MHSVRNDRCKQTNGLKGSILGYKPYSIHKKALMGETGTDLSKFSEKISEVKRLTEDFQKTVFTFQDRATKLSYRNKEIFNENSKLKEKIKRFEKLKKQPKLPQAFSPSNASIPTQETERFLLKKSSFSVSSCSSVDSIGILKDQVEHIKEFKQIQKSNKKVTMHKKTNSIENYEKMLKSDLGSSNGFFEGYCEEQMGLGYKRSTAKKLLHDALMCKIPVLRFN